MTEVLHRSIDKVGPHDRAVRAAPSELAARLQAVLGQKLTALLAGTPDPKAVGEWTRGARAPHPGKEARLRVAFQIVELLLQAESERTVRAWFLGMNPYLDDRSPASVIADGKEPQAALEAAYAFLGE
ncbi:MAG TPA: XRE family transcriptional regulator [Chloroflexota bacterium]|nr:XRE family transcriptional regulator [Chloroflexota bacterium]